MAARNTGVLAGTRCGDPTRSCCVREVLSQPRGDNQVATAKGVPSATWSSTPTANTDCSARSWPNSRTAGHGRTWSPNSQTTLKQAGHVVGHGREEPGTHAGPRP